AHSLPALDWKLKIEGLRLWICAAASVYHQVTFLGHYGARFKLLVISHSSPRVFTYVGQPRPLITTSTPAVQCPAFLDFAQLRLNRSTPLLSANCTCAKLRPISLGLQRF